MPARKVKRKACSKCGTLDYEGFATIGKHTLCFPCWDKWREHSTALFTAELERWVEQKT